MATPPGEYRNPVLAADFSDPDVIRVGHDFYLTASSFHRVPGLPLLHSPDLVHWTIIGHALPRLLPDEHYRRVRRGAGVWAPAIRHHAGRFWIFYADPDHGIQVVTAAAARGPWSQPHLLVAGRGLIDPCPLWDHDGTAYLVHAWARSRSGISNRLTAHRMSPDGRRVLGGGATVVDGDAIAGCHTLEGPKWYRRDGWYWILAAAGGVATGWQSALRSRTVWGPYEHRVVLAQGASTVNGPHQGGWVSTGTGQDWFLHFQDRGPYGRVVHLQPMRWRADGWPVMGIDDGSGCGTPVTTHPVPVATGTTPAPPGPVVADELTAAVPGPLWTWQANPGADWAAPAGDGLRLACRFSAAVDLRELPQVLGRRLPDGPLVVTARIALRCDLPGARTGLAVLGDSYAWAGLERTPDAVALVHRVAAPDAAEVDAVPPLPLADGQAWVSLRIEITDAAECLFSATLDDGRALPPGPTFPATPGRWVGATLGVFATTTTTADGPVPDGPVGHAVVASLRWDGSC